MKDACPVTPIPMMGTGWCTVSGADGGLLKRAIIESFDIVPALFFSLTEWFPGPNPLVSWSKPLLLDDCEANCPLLLLPLLLLLFDLEVAPTKSSKSLSFVVLVSSEKYRTKENVTSLSENVFQDITFEEFEFNFSK